jgi:hypothetical protein
MLYYYGCLVYFDGEVSCSTFNKVESRAVLSYGSLVDAFFAAQKFVPVNSLFFHFSHKLSRLVPIPNRIIYL